MLVRLLFSTLLLACGGFGWCAFADEEAAIKALQSAGGLVLQISADSEDREIALQLAGDKIGDEQLKLVSQINHVVWLNLAGTAVTDAGAAMLRQALPNTHIHH